MKVAYVLNSNGLYGGATKSFLIMLDGLCKKGVKPVVVLPEAGGLQTKLKDMGVETVVLNYRPNIYPYDQSIADYLFWMPRLVVRRYLNKKATMALVELLADVDIIHTNVSVIDIGSRAARILGKPHIYHFREYGDKDFGYKYYPSKAAFLSSVTNSICITRGIQCYHHLESNEMSQVIYNPVASVKAEMPRGEKQDYILYAGRLQATKGIEFLLEAYAKSTCRYRLLVAGDSKDSEYGIKVKALSQNLGLNNRVEFLGNRQDIDKLMQCAQAVVVPSFFEGFGRTMAESMINGTLVIGNNTGGTKEQFDNGKTFTGSAIGLAYTSKEELVEILSSLNKADDRMLLNAFNTVKHFYSRESCVEQVYNIYMRLIR